MAAAAITLLVSGIGIMNVMLVSVSERMHEIGIRKAVGATNRQILGQFITEAVMLSVIGSILGVILAALPASCWVYLPIYIRILTGQPPVSAVWRLVVWVFCLALFRPLGLLAKTQLRRYAVSKAQIAATPDTNITANVTQPIMVGMVRLRHWPIMALLEPIFTMKNSTIGATRLLPTAE